MKNHKFINLQSKKEFLEKGYKNKDKSHKETLEGYQQILI